MNRTTQWLLPVLLILACCSCGEQPLTEGLVASLNGDPVTLEQFREYLEESLSPEDEPDTALTGTEPGELDRVRSRLFDIFIDERLLAGEARRRYGKGTDAFDRLFSELALEAGEPDTEAVDALVAERSAEFREDRTLMLRALMLQDPALAERVYDQVRRNRMTFSEAVAAHESTPGQGAPMETTLGSLPEEVRGAIEELKAGRVSRPVEVHGIIYLFLVEAWRDAAGPADGGELREEARAEIRSRMIQDAAGRLLLELRKHPKVRIETERLPFPYVTDTPVQVE
ncbi:MAG: peptidylprolyl isomerase [Acidobacteria bacterium]|uniref:peptidylprolyl isomerase n=1 Tax=Candidatus Polarisedimenticola svalbardensis TaxID=2886004 RepID=A0A8J6Y2L1_9BACT|nr:peptidylprolyl isomerase [Candidatus Polarisedimenticola svalbardensis]